MLVLNGAAAGIVVGGLIIMLFSGLLGLGLILMIGGGVGFYLTRKGCPFPY